MNLKNEKENLMNVLCMLESSLANIYLCFASQQVVFATSKNTQMADQIFASFFLKATEDFCVCFYLFSDTCTPAKILRHLLTSQ